MHVSWLLSSSPCHFHVTACDNTVSHTLDLCVSRMMSEGCQRRKPFLTLLQESQYLLLCMVPPPSLGAMPGPWPLLNRVTSSYPGHLTPQYKDLQSPLENLIHKK